MSQVTVHGYPDFNRYATRSDVIVFGDTVALTAIARTYGYYYVGNYEYLNLLVRTAGQWTITIDWGYDLNGGVAVVNTITYETFGSGDFTVCLAVLSPKARFTFTPIGGAQGLDVLVWATGVPIRTATGDAAPKVLISATNRAVAAGNTDTITASGVLPGNAHWVVGSALATWTAELQAMHSSGATTEIDILTQAQNYSNRRVLLPPRTMRTVFTNPTAGAGTYTVALVGSGDGV